ncbi:hypothetical protein Hamer_G026881 [Homarus americanus]|uniref:Uncharacterized protein n=1 Tax=Homarus americanus TaxID=6706 RepID=A0A8J5K842_HOMAM|nr:hypothetical protein Hamer_G026881 [Homarus americanus]
MAGYLTWLTWVLLLALCYTPTPAHSGSFGSAGIGGGGGNEFTLDGIHDGPWIGDDGYIGGSDADSTGPVGLEFPVLGVILRTPIQLFNSTVRVMAGYLTCLTWVLLLALCYTPTPAHSENVGLVSDGRGQRLTRNVHLIIAGGHDAYRPGPGALLRTRPGRRGWSPPIRKGPPLTQFA